MPVGRQRRRALRLLLLLSLVGFISGMLTAVRRFGARSSRFVEGRGAVGVIHEKSPPCSEDANAGRALKGA